MELVAKVKDAEHWALLRDASNKKLLDQSVYTALCLVSLLLVLELNRYLHPVVDVHKDWCGPCKIMEPTYKRLAVDIEQFEKRFASLNVTLGVEGVEDTGSCKPRFVLIRERKQIAELNGANAPQLEQLVKQHC